MAYEKTTIPRFFIDEIQYLKNSNVKFRQFYLKELDDFSTTIVDTSSAYNKIFNEDGNTSEEDMAQMWDFNESEAIELRRSFWELEGCNIPNFSKVADFDAEERNRYYAGFESDITLKELFNPNDTNFFLAILNTNITTGRNNASYSADIGLEIHINKKQLNFADIIYGNELPTDGIIRPKGNNCIYKITPNFENIDNVFTMAMINQEASLNDMGSVEYNANVQKGFKINTIGAIVFGKMYEMDIAPDLNIKQTIEYRGGRTQKTLAGKNITINKYTGSRWWYRDVNDRRAPFENKEDNNYITIDESILRYGDKRAGRRVWNMKFSYLEDSKIFPANSSSSTYAENTTFVSTDYIDSNNFGSEIINGGDFSDPSLWTTSNASISGGVADMTSISSSGTQGSVKQNATLPAGNYRIKIKATGGTGGTSGNAFWLRFHHTVDVGLGWEKISIANQPFYSSSDPNFEGYIQEGDTVSFDFEFSLPVDCNEIEIRGMGYSNSFFNGTFDDFSITRIYDYSDFSETIQTSNSFYSQVLNKVSNGEKFIFQPDKDSEEFAICTLDTKSLKIQQEAINVYTISMQIKEAW